MIMIIYFNSLSLLLLLVGNAGLVNSSSGQDIFRLKGFL